MTTPTFNRIASRLLPKWLEHFKTKNTDYSSQLNDSNGYVMEPHTVLGAAGQFGDIWRKVWKLKKALWDGSELNGEQPEEILLDLIGHCFLTLDLLEQKQAERTVVAFDGAASSSRMVMVSEVAGNPLVTTYPPASDVKCDRLVGYRGSQLHCDRASGHPGGCLPTYLAMRAGKMAECGKPFPCGHAPDGGNHPVVPGA